MAPTGRPRSGETQLTVRITEGQAQILAALATAKGITVHDYVVTDVITAHLHDNESNPVLDAWFRVNYPLLDRTPQQPPKKGKKA